MAAPTNLETTLNSVGQRESLSDIIYRTAPEDTPLFSALAKGNAKARYEEWQTESLRPPSADNANLEGDDVGTLDAPNRTTRVGNYNQIFDETGGTSGTQDAVNMAGRADEMARQKSLKGLEVRTDVEMSLFANNASQNESGSNPREMAGVLAWLETNTDRGVGGTDGGFNTGTNIVDAAGNGTQRAFTEAQVKTIMASCFSNGARPSMVFVGPTHKQQFSEFTGIADIRREVRGTNQAVITAAAEIYVSDFGDLQIIPHPYALTRDAVFITPNRAEVRVLRGFQTKRLAKNGDNERFQILYEATFCCKNEKAHGVIADLS